MISDSSPFARGCADGQASIPTPAATLRPPVTFDRAQNTRRTLSRSRHAQVATLNVRKTAAQESGSFAGAVLDRQQLLLTVLTDTNHDQQTHLRVLPEPDLDVDTSHEEVRVAENPRCRLENRA